MASIVPQTGNNSTIIPGSGTPTGVSNVTSTINPTVTSSLSGQPATVPNSNTVDVGATRNSDQTVIPTGSTSGSGSGAGSGAGSGTGTGTGTDTSSTTADTTAKINDLLTLGTSSATAAGQAGITQGISTLTAQGSSAAEQAQAQQNAINLARTQIGTTQINTIKQLQQSIKDGLQGAGANLANTGALGSSAAAAVARAYAEYGDQQTNNANNTAATANNAQDVQQSDLMSQLGTDQTQLDAAKSAAVSNIQAQAQQAIDTIATQITYLGGDPTQYTPQLNSAVSQIIQQAQADLAQVDQNYDSIMSGINPATQQQTAQAAEAASNQGVVPASGAPYNPVGSTTPAPAMTEGGAPPPSLIPLTLGPAQNNQIPGQ